MTNIICDNKQCENCGEGMCQKGKVDMTRIIINDYAVSACDDDTTPIHENSIKVGD